jgi:hypothetical protein
MNRLDETRSVIQSGGKHAQLVTMLKTTLGMGHGDANTLVHMVKKSAEESLCQLPAQEAVRHHRSGHQHPSRSGAQHEGNPQSERLKALPAGQMCNYRIKLTRPQEVDTELLSWIQKI